MRLNLGSKIGGGFAAILTIALVLGGIAVFSMRSVSGQSKMLAEEYVPEVAVASTLQKDYGLYLQDMIYYALTSADNYLESAEQKFATVATDLDQVKALADTSENLVKLRESIGTLVGNIDEYKTLADQTVEINGSINQNRQTMDNSAANFMDACSKFMASQNRSQQREIASGAGQQKQRERAQKISLVNDIITLGNTARVEAWKAQARRDPEGLKSALALFPQIDEKLNKLRPITYQKVDIDEINSTQKAAGSYRDAVKGYLDNWTKLNEVAAKRTPLAFAVQEQVIATADKGMSEALTIAQNAESSLSKASITMMIGLIIALVIGVGLAVYITRMITRPVIEIADLAGAIAKGDLSKNIEVRSDDEIGQMATSCREMTAALKGKADAAAAIADGNLGVKVDVASNHDVLGNAMVKMVESLQKMNGEVQELTKAALEGQLDTRANAEAHRGDYGKLVGGINQLLDAIVAPIQEGASVLSTAANKDLTKRVQGSYKGQLADLKDNINSTIEALDQALSQVNEAVEQVSSASGQISSGSQSLAAGANQQASNLEEISSSLEEMSSMTRQNSDNANQANSLSGTARESAVRGSKSMGQMTEAINRIKTSSDETAKIVKTIDEIAFQTNLLALNAAVEAARAGEAGKGFAVVAEEVRNLAQRSAEAAKNTAAMIEDAVKNADDGVSITEEVAKVLGEIVDGASRVNDLVAEISAAAGEQTQGIEQINTSVSQMDQLTQQNASNSEESASAAEELNSQAEELRRMVAEFKLSRKQMSATAAKQAQPSRAKETVDNPTEKPEVVNRVKKMTSKSGNGNGNGKKSGNGSKNRIVAPEEVIPLDDADFGDF